MFCYLDTCHLGDCRVLARQPVLAFGFFGWYVLSLPYHLPFTKGNVVKTLIVGLVALIIGLYFVTDMAPDFTMAANQVFAATGDNAAHIPDGFSGGALDFASSLFGWAIYRGVKLSYVGMGILAIITIALMVINRKRIVSEERRTNTIL